MLWHVKDFYFNGPKYGKLIFDYFRCIYLSVIMGKSKLINFFPERGQNTKCSYHSLDQFLCQSCPKYILHSPWLMRLAYVYWERFTLVSHILHQQFNPCQRYFLQVLWNFQASWQKGMGYYQLLLNCSSIFFIHCFP